MELQKLISDLVKNHEFSFICPNCNSDIKVESTVEI